MVGITGPDAFNAAVIVKDAEGDFWTYGHTASALTVGTQVQAGSQIGTVHYMTEAGKNISHLHIGVLTQYPHGMDGWGRDTSITDVINNTMNPLQAYASIGNNNWQGTSEADTIRGLQGNDVIAAGGANDVVIGGTGLDTLDGGAGNDIFDYNAIADSPSLAGSDGIGFQYAGNAAGDRIDLSTIDATTGLTGNNAFTYTGTNAPAAGSGAGKLWTQDYYQSNFGYVTLINASVDADKDPELVIRANDGTATAANWVVGDFVV